MNIILPSSAYMLPELKGRNSGVDFLGLRQTNLDIMADLIPSTNNVTEYVRPFSLLAWIFWKFHGLCVESGIDEPTSEQARQFRERIEILFTWGARIGNCPGIPGRQAEPPKADENGWVPLNFEAWKRVQDSTSLIAALWYGPASKSDSGLGFLAQVKPGIFRTVGAGTRLATALDIRLRTDTERYTRLLATLAPVSASETDAEALWDLWRPDAIDPEEQDAFACALFDPEAVGDYQSALGKRSSTLSLARLHINEAGVPQGPNDVRRGMLHSQRPDGSVYSLPPELGNARDKWVILQARQLQRLALESLLSWVEGRVIDGLHDTSELIDVLTTEWDESEYSFTGSDKLDEILAGLDARFTTMEQAIQAFRNGGLHSPLELLELIREAFSKDGRYAAHCLYSIMWCASFTRCMDPDHPLLRIGGPGRIPLYHLRSRLSGLGNATVRETISYVLEAMIISQHFATAVNRFDGQNQRLRLAIEETGLDALVPNPWVPTVTGDRLDMLLSLAADCGLIQRGEEGNYLNP